MAIFFFTEDISFSLRQKNKHKTWINDIILNQGMVPGTVNFIFCSDPYLHNINVKYLNHDTLTDIITFATSSDSDGLSGDLFISIDRVKENADLLQVSVDDELDRVMAHGVLHLLGFDDKSEKDILEIRKKEDHCLSLRTF